MTSEAISSPAAEGTNAFDPGISLRTVHFLAVHGGQMQWFRQDISISSIGLMGFSSE